MLKRVIYLLCLCLCRLFISTSAYAADNLQSTQNTTVELFNNGVDSVIAKFTLKPNWHIYWSNPGEIGLPTTIQAQNSQLQVVNQSVPKIRTLYESMNEYLYEDTAYFELRLNNLKNAQISFDFVECNDVCQPQKIVFDMAQLSPTEPKLWQQTQTLSRASFPLQIKLISSNDKNEVEFETSAQNILFVPAEQDKITPESIQINTGRHPARISWQAEPGQQLHKALIVANGQAYIANISYRQNYFTLLYVIALAFIGGIILNTMPCVFPILSLKIFSLLKQRKRSKLRARINALLYTCGVLFSFLLLTACLVILKENGSHAGWGFQLQSPWFVGIMALIFFLIFLYIMEWLRFPNFANRLIHKASGFNDFTTGFFAVLVASPCTGPFMGAAIGYAFMRPNPEVFAVFTALALGYALPYALIEMFPQAINKIMPKPGKWMRKIKIVLSIPILCTALWLGEIWYSQITDSHLQVATASQDALHWQVFDAQKIALLNQNNENIFIDFTADWCLTCKFNEKVLLNSTRFKNFVNQNNVRLFVADMTENNELFYQALASYGRDSIPLYVYYHNGQYQILPLFFGIDDLK